MRTAAIAGSLAGSLTSAAPRIECFPARRPLSGARLGADPPAALVDEVSCELHVMSRTGPCFIWHTREDSSVPYQNSTLFAAALQAHGVPFELHVFDRGAHGLGKDLRHPWAAVCSHWLAERFTSDGG